MKRAWRWPAVIALSAFAAALGVTGLLPGPLRMAATLWFVTVCPGMAFVRLMRVESALARWPLAIALSLALDLLVAEIMAVSGLWSPAGGLGFLIVLSLIGVLLQLRARPRPLQPAAGEGA